jgi:hypothetical protein
MPDFKMAARKSEMSEADLQKKRDEKTQRPTESRIKEDEICDVQEQDALAACSSNAQRHRWNDTISTTDTSGPN